MVSDAASLLFFSALAATPSIWYQSNAKIKCTLTNLKNDQQRFYGEEHILPT
jgi:hypothetical protein